MDCKFICSPSKNRVCMSSSLEKNVVKLRYLERVSRKMKLSHRGELYHNRPFHTRVLDKQTAHLVWQIAHFETPHLKTVDSAPPHSSFYLEGKTDCPSPYFRL